MKLLTSTPSLATDLYERNASLFHRLSKRLTEAQSEHHTAENRWLELEAMRQGVEQP